MRECQYVICLIVNNNNKTYTLWCHEDVGVGSPPLPHNLLNDLQMKMRTAFTSIFKSKFTNKKVEWKKKLKEIYFVFVSNKWQHQKAIWSQTFQFTSRDIHSNIRREKKIGLRYIKHLCERRKKNNNSIWCRRRTNTRKITVEDHIQDMHTNDVHFEWNQVNTARNAMILMGNQLNDIHTDCYIKHNKIYAQISI